MPDVRLPVPPGAAVAGFDSASAMLRALGRFLHGRDFPLLGVTPPAAGALVHGALGALERLPRRLRQEIYGVDEDRFPQDFGALARYQRDLARVRHRLPLPPPLALGEAEGVLADLGADHGVELADAPRLTATG